MFPQPAAYSFATNKAVMRQASKKGSTAIQVEGWDAMQIAIYRKEYPPWWESKTSSEREK